MQLPPTTRSWMSYIHLDILPTRRSLQETFTLVRPFVTATNWRQYSRTFTTNTLVSFFLERISFAHSIVFALSAFASIYNEIYIFVVNTCVGHFNLKLETCCTVCLFMANRCNESRVSFSYWSGLR
jgi:hypothetical protein